VVAQDLDSRADDEDHQERVQQVLGNRPEAEAGVVLRTRALVGTRMARDEALNRRHPAQPFRERDGGDEEDEADREEPEQVEPAASSNAHARRDAVGRGHRAGPGRGVDHVLSDREAPAKAPDVRG
jgi:hypothetical protein